MIKNNKDPHYFTGVDGKTYVAQISLAGRYEVFEVPKTLEETNKHLKGFIYDSLAYRYIRAREAMAELEFQRKIACGDIINKQQCYKQANKDIIKFCQILDEAIGEHD